MQPWNGESHDKTDCHRCRRDTGKRRNDADRSRILTVIKELGPERNLLAVCSGDSSSVTGSCLLQDQRSAALHHGWRHGRAHPAGDSDGSHDAARRLERHVPAWCRNRCRTATVLSPHRTTVSPRTPGSRMFHWLRDSYGYDIREAERLSDHPGAGYHQVHRLPQICL